MSDDNQIMNKEKPAADADTVAAYLQENPDFFIGRDDLIENITVPHETGKAISLLERQLTILRVRNEQYQEQIRHLMDTASANDVLFEKTRILILSLLKCTDLESLSTTLNEELGKLFDSIESHLFFISDIMIVGAGTNPEKVKMKSWTEAQQILGEFFEKKRTHCGRLNIDQAQYFFPDRAETIASAAIVPIHIHPEQDAMPSLPVLVTGSTNPDYFHSNQDTLFLDFIGEVLAVLLGRILGH